MRLPGKPDVSLVASQLRLRQHGTLLSFFTKILHRVQNFCEKE
jgi:hypothetical protein